MGQAEKITKIAAGAEGQSRIVKIAIDMRT